MLLIVEKKKKEKKDLNNKTFSNKILHVKHYRRLEQKFSFRAAAFANKYTVQVYNPGCPI